LDKFFLEISPSTLNKKLTLRFFRDPQEIQWNLPCFPAKKADKNQISLRIPGFCQVIGNAIDPFFVHLQLCQRPAGSALAFIDTQIKISIVCGNVFCSWLYLLSFSATVLTRSHNSRDGSPISIHSKRVRKPASTTITSGVAPMT
jgi:hypothetical protein